MKSIAIDLGTCNSCICQTVDGTVKIVHLPEFAEENGTIPTTILYKNNKPLAIGQVAETEFFVNNSESYKLATQFKPDIGGEEAYTYLRDFLKILQPELVKAVAHTANEASSFYVGTPCNLNSEEYYDARLKKCFSEAFENDDIFGSPSVLKEPIGALLSCLISEDALNANNAINEILVIDFGGGTCDLSLLTDGAVQLNSGDNLFGGRLFDDLFYQMFLKQNPELEHILKQNKCEYYFQFIECRRIKEFFSTEINKYPDEKINLIAQIPILNGPPINVHASCDRDDFVFAAGTYVMSEALFEMLKTHHTRGMLSNFAKEALARREIDLLSWFKSLLQNFKGKKFSKVLLTGGSSLWPFVPYFVKQEFSLQDADIIISNNPYSDISRGLALAPYLSEKFAKSEKAINASLGDFLSKLFDEVHEINATQGRQVANICAELIVKRVLMPQLQEAIKKGGWDSIEVLQKNILAQMEKEKEFIKQNIYANAELYEELLQQKTKKIIEDWLISHGIDCDLKINLDHSLQIESIIKLVDFSITKTMLLNITDMLLTVYLPIIVGALVAVGTSITGPLAVFLGASASISTFALGKSSQYLMKKIPIPLKLLNQKMVNEICEKNIVAIGKKISAAFEQKLQEIDEQVQQDIEKEIAVILSNLSIIKKIAKHN